MAGMIERLAETINTSFVPPDQKWLRESVVIGRTPKSMDCEIQPGKDQLYLLCKFDRSGYNNQLFPYFNPKIDGLVSMCDYILFVEEPHRLLVLLLELKLSDSPLRQLKISQPFGCFLCERIRVLFDDFSKPFVFRKIGIQQKYKPKHTTQDYRFEFDNNGFALLPNPNELLLRMVSKVI